jgi:hypothetical protein
MAQKFLTDIQIEQGSDLYLKGISAAGSDFDMFAVLDSTTKKVMYRTGAQVYSDIGVTSHSGLYLPLTGGTLTGSVILNGIASGAETYMRFRNNSSSIGFIGSPAVIGGLAADFVMFVYGNNSLRFFTNDVERLNISGSGAATFSGTISASNLSGTNTGDQNLSGYSLTSHNHAGVYEPVITKNTGFLTSNGSSWIWDATTYSVSTHAHGNITSGGYLGSTASLPLITGTGGKIEAGSFGTTAGTFAQGNHNHSGVYDPAGTTATHAALTTTAHGLGASAFHIETYYAYVSHAHGNITNTGYIGSTANLPIITGTGGILQAGSFGTTSGTFAQGDHTHSGVYDPAGTTATHAALTTTAHGLGASAFHIETYYAYVSHAHGNITNTGYIGTTANLPIITGTAGILQAGSFGTTSGTFAQGDHTHSGVYDPAGTGHAEAAAHVTLHESNYNHSNFATAYGWGNHSGLYLPLAGGTITGPLIQNGIASGAETYMRFRNNSSSIGFIGSPAVLGAGAGNAADMMIFCYDNYSLRFVTNWVERLTISGSGAATFSGTVTASNLSGTNTGDQNLSGYSLTSHTHSGYEVAGTSATHAALTTTAHNLGASAFHADAFFCLTGDSRLSDARASNDVYAWAKASTPTFTTLVTVATGSGKGLSFGTVANFWTDSFGTVLLYNATAHQFNDPTGANRMATLGATGMDLVSGSKYKIGTVNILQTMAGGTIDTNPVYWKADDVLGVTRKAIADYVEANAAPISSAPSGSATIYKLKVSKTAAQLAASYSTPVEIINQPAAGYAIRILDVTFRINSSGVTPFSGTSCSIDIYTKNTPAGETQFGIATFDVVSSTTRFGVGVPSNRIDTISGTTANNVKAEEPIMLKAYSSNISGNATIDIYLTYRFIQL